MPNNIENKTKNQTIKSPCTPRRKFNIGGLDNPQCPILGIKDTILSSNELDSHSHIRGQLAYATAGIIKVYTEDGCWVIPSSQAVWIPGNMNHSVTAEVDAEIRHLFVDPTCLHRFPTQCSVLDMTPLLRELIMRVADLVPITKWIALQHVFVLLSLMNWKSLNLLCCIYRGQKIVVCRK